MKRAIRTRLVGEHAPDCAAVANSKSGRWPTPWCLGRHVFANFWGNKSHNLMTRNHSWIEFRCNDTHCTALLLVHETDLLCSVQT